MRYVDEPLDVDFVSGVLRSHNGDGEVVYSGAANIYTEGRQIFLKMYCNNVDVVDDYNRIFGSGQRGCVIGDDRMLQFEGVCVSGETWKIPNVWARGATYYATSSKIINTKVAEVHLVRDNSCENSITYVIAEELKIPYNKYSERGGVSSLSDMEILHDMHRVYLSKENGFTYINIKYGSDIVDICEVVLEAISFLVGKELLCCVKKGCSGYVFYSERSDMHGKTLQSPLDLNFGRNESFVDFVLKYISCDRYVSKIVFDKFRFALGASGSMIDLHALAISISSESIVDLLIKKVVPEDYDFNNIIDDYISSIPSDTCERIVNVVKRSLGMAKNINVKRCLNYLRENKVIRKAHIKSWDLVRNRVAHGNYLKWNEADGVQKSLDHYFNVLHLFYLLCFYCVKYEGEHVDYGTRNYPRRFILPGQVLEDLS